jgi:two-component system, LytTR family, sensor kinase
VYDFLAMDASSAKPQQSRWFWIASIWFAIGLFDATQTVFSMRAEGMHHAWVRLFVTLLFSWLPWALATPLLVHLAHRYPPVHLRPLVTWLVHSVACGVVGLICAAWTAWLDKLLNPWANSQPLDPFTHLWLYKFSNAFLGSMILYIAILAFSYVLQSRERLARQQTEAASLCAQLSQAQLDALRRQIEPHFLFNALNAISGLVREQQNDAAVTMIAGLSDFLRRVVKDSDRQQVPLGEELEFLQKYLDIQKVRFAERLQVSVEVPRELFPAEVPTLILQPIVENAIKHGIGRRAHGGIIRITGSRSNGMLTLNVYNDGPNLPVGREKSQVGVGMSNLGTRLQSLYGNKFELKIRNCDPDGVEVSISLPFQE